MPIVLIWQSVIILSNFTISYFSCSQLVTNVNTKTSSCSQAESGSGSGSAFDKNLLDWKKGEGRLAVH